MRSDFSLLRMFARPLSPAQNGAQAQSIGLIVLPRRLPRKRKPAARAAVEISSAAANPARTVHPHGESPPRCADRRDVDSLRPGSARGHYALPEIERSVVGVPGAAGAVDVA